MTSLSYPTVTPDELSSQEQFVVSFEALGGLAVQQATMRELAVELVLRSGLTYRTQQLVNARWVAEVTRHRGRKILAKTRQMVSEHAAETEFLRGFIAALSDNDRSRFFDVKRVS